MNYRMMAIKPKLFRTCQFTWKENWLISLKTTRKRIEIHSLGLNTTAHTTLLILLYLICANNSKKIPGLGGKFSSLVLTQAQTSEIWSNSAPTAKRSGTEFKLVLLQLAVVVPAVFGISWKTLFLDMTSKELVEDLFWKEKDKWIMIRNKLYKIFITQRTKKWRRKSIEDAELPWTLLPYLGLKTLKKSSTNCSKRQIKKKLSTKSPNTIKLLLT